ncbi:radical SAM domain protein [Desulfosarcina variabilis str. Montpellier]|uniref:thio(seleno)oxazole modification radical SAM maturase SbtM n=1 Tax=Desulfosarcina variabilis TaxID=2300 RepID=UPI003AFAA13B
MKTIAEIKNPSIDGFPHRIVAALGENARPDHFPDTLSARVGPMALPGYIVDLARLEWRLHQTQSLALDLPSRINHAMVNPTLTILESPWKHLAELIRMNADGVTPIEEPSHVIIWKHPQTGALHYEEAKPIDLLALKLIVEQIDPKAVAPLGNGNATPGDLQHAIDQAVTQGMLLSPGSRIHRTAFRENRVDPCFEPFLTTDVFTLQWHITQHCDLHCKHCYDRSDRAAMSEAEAMKVLADLFDFCRHMHVRGQVTFTGGNPMLYPHIECIYRAATQYGFGIAILGNPGPIDDIRRLKKIAQPLYFQVSLEGLASHNDVIRGKGHFDRTIRFLEQLRGLGIFTMVMLTLTQDNLDQILPLAADLKNRVDAFNFNRLSAVGEGATLAMVDREKFATFLQEYLSAAEGNPIMGLKDNLFNIIRHESGHPPIGGCTGHGCGAAFNFLALLPDGEIHACRKFPSPLGNILDTSLIDIYHRRAAERYRAGSLACGQCRLNPVCRGCMAVSHSLGLDIFNDKDPFCFFSCQVTPA